MSDNLKYGPINTLILEMSQEWINLLQATHDTFMEEGDLENASKTSAKLERMCLLRGMAELAFKRQEPETSGSLLEKLAVYLQEHDPEVFPFEFETHPTSPNIYYLITSKGVSAETAQWLDENIPGQVIMNLAIRG